ncbi:MAG TPA: hypothetical protein VMX94_05375 [Armatimonadota bacterium]|nr:hypothetical protein [Armatimonadota bacterium]
MVSLIAELVGLQKTQWLAGPELERIQARKLRQVIAHAYSSVPLYKSLFDSAGLSPVQVSSVSDLSRLPIVSKADIQRAGRSAFAQNVDLSGCVWLKTSGSDGSALSLPFTKLDKARRVLKEIRALIANGFRLTDRMILIVEPRCVVEHNAWFQKLGLLRRKCLSIFCSPAEQLVWIRSWKAQALYGYTSELRILADILVGSQTGTPPMRLVITSAELLEPVARRSIEKAFGVAPTDFYGSMELGWIAWECPERAGYHMNSDCLIVECVKDGRPAVRGEEGELVITNLYSFAAPLIRYATGDVGTLSTGSCKCGRGLPLISSIRGRMVDRVVLPSGEMISPYVLTCAIENVPGVKRFQIVQDDSSRLRVDFVPACDPEEIVPLLAARIERVVGPTMQVDVRPVDDIHREESGKFKVVKSELGRACGVADRV